MPPEEDRDAGRADDTAALLAAAHAGDRASWDRAFARIYDELKRVAAIQAARFAGRSTMQTTALLHEAYLKLSANAAFTPMDRTHFYAVAARAMRQILIDHARHGARQKRGGSERPIPFDAVELAAPVPAELGVEDLLALDRALDRLVGADPDLGRLVEWRCFAGLTLDEIAELSGRSESSLKRDWNAALAFLSREMGGQVSLPA